MKWARKQLRTYINGEYDDTKQKVLSHSDIVAILHPLINSAEGKSFVSNSEIADALLNAGQIPKEKALSKEEISGALARGYCTDRNSKKVLDSTLIEDMISELTKAGQTPKTKVLTKEEIIDVLKPFSWKELNGRAVVSVQLEEVVDALISAGQIKKVDNCCTCKDKPVRLISHCRNCGKIIKNPPTIKEMITAPEKKVDVGELKERIKRKIRANPLKAKQRLESFLKKDAAEGIEELKKATEIIDKEWFTLDAYLRNDEFIMHHDRFKKMIFAFKVIKKSLADYLKGEVE